MIEWFLICVFGLSAFGLGWLAHSTWSEWRDNDGY